jgi:hypothetical protein
MYSKNFVKRSGVIHKRKYGYEKTIYVKATEKVIITCPTHGDFLQTPNNHLAGHGCPKCKGVKKSLSVEDFMHKAKAAHKGRYKYADLSDRRLTTKIKIVCPSHGEFTQDIKVHLAGHGCPKCKGGSKITTAEFINRARMKHGERYRYTKSKYTNAVTPVTITCPTHGDFLQTPGSHISGRGCSQCGLEKKTSTRLQSTLVKLRSDYPEYQFSSINRAGNTSVLSINCKEHGEFTMGLNGFVAGGGLCPHCRPKSIAGKSKLEAAVTRWVAKLTRVVSGERSLLGTEIDIYCPEHRLGIEVNGLYWHREQFKSTAYHYDKTLLAKQTGVKLLQFWEHELRHKTQICKSIIRHNLGMSDRYYARQLEIRQLTRQKDWFENNHLQGGVGAYIAYGLFNDDECVCAMSFGRPRMSKDCDWELLRFANLLNTTVIGGASRILKHFIREHKPKMIVSYADLCISQGNLYKQLGFEFSHRSIPNYWWTKNLIRLSRYQTQKHKLAKLLGDMFVEAKSESCNMVSAGYSKIYDAGNLVFHLRSKE